MAETNKTKKFLTYEGLAYFKGKEKVYIDDTANAARVAAIDASEVTVDTTTTTEGYAKSYTLKQNGATVTTIDIPKDMVVSSGRVVTNPEGQAEGTYLELTLANATSDKIYINVGTLIDIYTAQANATQVQIAVDNSTNVISATIVDGSIDTDALANKAVTAAKIADDTITTTQLASSITTSLGKADTAVQSVTASNASTGTDGTITVDGDEVAVKGYSTLAGRVQTLENATIEEISNDDIDELFASAPVDSPAE